MRKMLNKTVIAVIVCVSVLILSNTVEASWLNLKKLDYQVQLNTDGTANVVETWTIDIEDTNTLFKTFEIDTSKYKEITNVGVQEVKNLGNVNFTRIYQEKYHVDKNCKPSNRNYYFTKTSDRSKRFKSMGTWSIKWKH